MRETPPPAAFLRPVEGESSTSPARPLLFAALLVATAGVAIAALAGGARMDPAQAEDIRTVSGTITALGAIGAFVLCRDLGRQTDDIATVWVGTATLAVAVGVVCRPEVLGAVLGDRGPEGWLAALAAAGMVVVPVLFVIGLWSPLPPLRVSAAGALAAVVALSVLIHAVPRAGRALSIAELTRADGAAGVAGGAVLLAIWVALATANVARGARRQPSTQAWAGLMLLCLAAAALADGEGAPGNAWTVGAAGLEVLAVTAVLGGAHLELRRAHEDQTVALVDSALEAETADVRERVRAAGLRARRHDLVNAITAIDGAAMVLEREFQRLSEADRAALTHMVGTGVARLRSLMAPETGAGTPVALAQTASAVARGATWSTPLVLEVPPDLVAAGSPEETTEAVRQLVDYATRRAPGPVTMRGERDGPWVVLRVEDRGPDVPRELRRSMADPDSRREPGREDAIGVRVAARLMRGQGGDLWVQSLPGGGTSFAICLPALRDTNGDETVRDT